MTENEHHNEHPKRAPADEKPHHKRPTTLERAEAAFVGGLVLIGTMLTISSTHKVAAVWVFFAAYLIIGLAVAMRLTNEFSEPPPKKVDKQTGAPLETPTPPPASTPMSNINITSFGQSGGFTGINKGTVNLGPAPRRITPEQARRMSQFISHDGKKPSAKVDFWYVSGDQETAAFANELAALLTRNGFELVTGAPQSVWMAVGLQPGITLAVKSRETAPFDALRIAGCLAAEDIPFSVGLNEDLEPNVVKIWVGLRPIER